MPNEYKAQAGADRLFWWLAPEPLQLASTPTLALRHADVGTVAPVLSAIAAEGTVTAIDQYQTELTLSAPIADVGGINGQYGEAFLITEEDGYFPVRVKRIDGTQVLLAESTTTIPSVTTNARLQFRRWYTTLTALDVTGTARRNWVAEATYIAQAGANVPAATHTDRRLLHVVLQPFDPGLTHEGLLEFFPDLAQLPAGRQQDFEPQIARAKGRLVSDIRSTLRNNDCSKYEDDVEGGTLINSFAHLVASLIYTTRNPELSALLEAKYAALLEKELEAVWIDCDGDGLPDEGENPTPAKAMVDTSTYFNGEQPTTIFTREDYH